MSLRKVEGMLQDDSQSFIVPPIIKLTYQNFKLIAETSSYRVFEAEDRVSHEKHAVRILDRTKEFVKKHFDHALTLFIQELLRLQYLHPGSVLLKTLEISSDGKQVACATLLYTPLSAIIDVNIQTMDAIGQRNIKKLLSDILSDVEFLWKDFQARKILSVLGPENVCVMKGQGGFFLTDWAKLFENGNDNLATSTLVAGAIQNPPNSQELDSELKTLAFTVLNLGNISCEEVHLLPERTNADTVKYESAVKKMLAKNFDGCQELQSLFERMLSLDPKTIPSLDEFKFKDVESRIKHNIEVEETKQTESDSTTISPLKKKKIIIIGNLPFMNLILLGFISLKYFIFLGAEK